MQTELSAALAIALFVGILKPALELVVGYSGAGHDAAIRGLALLLGVVGFLAHQAMTSTITPQALWDETASGVLAGATAVATYHLVAANPWDAIAGIGASAPAVRDVGEAEATEVAGPGPERP